MKKISYTHVSADIFHFGHLQLLRKAKFVADYHICGLYSDDLCLLWNGSLIMTFEERVSILEDLKCVDEIIEQTKIDPTDNLILIHKKYSNSKIILFQGHQEWEGMPGTNFIKSIGGKIIKPDYYPKLARSAIRDKLNNKGNMSTKDADIESYILGNVSYFSLFNSSKANTLESIKPHLNKSIIEKLFIFKKHQWRESCDEIVKQIKRNFYSEIIVRSSSLSEDTLLESSAGLFHSELNVDSQKSNSIIKAVGKVIRSYQRKDSATDNDQILIQDQTKDVQISGIVFTRNIRNNSPYYLINYDTTSLTNSVTSGIAGNKIEIARNLDHSKLKNPWKTLILAVVEIELLLDNLALDIEFAIKNNGNIVIFQVRPLAAVQKFLNVPEEKIFKSIESLKNEYCISKSNISPNQSFILSDMSFWNPAEIIGDRSSNLSYSLYRYIILQRAWNVGLIELGYKTLDNELAFRFGNKAYINIATAFEALLPSSLNVVITKKLISFYLNKLENNPELHDKIEFEVVHNCFSPTSDKQLEETKSILDIKEFKTFRLSLINLTQSIFDKYESIKESDVKSLKKLAENRTQKTLTEGELNVQEKIKVALDLLNDVRELGTPQFSRMARLAFIGNQYLKGLVSNSIISNSECDNFLSSIDTIASELDRDFNRVASNSLSKSEFLKHYGHLRPGTYDITKLPYYKNPSYFSINEQPDTFKNSLSSNKIDSSKIEKKLVGFLNNFEISISADNLLKFIKETIQFRESFKFEFTINLSLALELLSSAGQELGFDREMLSNLSIECLKGLSNSSSTMEISDFWHSIIRGKKEMDQIYSYISLPSIIFCEDDFDIIHSYSARPNYISNNVIIGDLIDLDNINIDDYKIVSNKIVLLEKADPGFDWIFTQRIKALITRFGGVGSHMAIRCAEFDIPAAIGCGEVIYSNLKNKNVVELDCKKRLISIIR